MATLKYAYVPCLGNICSLFLQSFATILFCMFLKSRYFRFRASLAEPGSHPPTQTKTTLNHPIPCLIRRKVLPNFLSLPPLLPRIIFVDFTFSPLIEITMPINPYFSWYYSSQFFFTEVLNTLVLAA